MALFTIRALHKRGQFWNILLLQEIKKSCSCSCSAGLLCLPSVSVCKRYGMPSKSWWMFTRSHHSLSLRSSQIPPEIHLNYLWYSAWKSPWDPPRRHPYLFQSSFLSRNCNVLLGSRRNWTHSLIFRFFDFLLNIGVIFSKSVFIHM